MKRALHCSTILAVASLAAGCGSENPVGPTERTGRPSLAGVGPGDLNGNGWVCGRRISDVAPGAVESYGAIRYVLVDDRDGVCPGGFERWNNI